MRSRARRSGVDHSLGMGEAPGSNPGESISFRHFVPSVNGLAVVPLAPLAGLPASPLIPLVSTGLGYNSGFSFYYEVTSASHTK